MAIRLRVNQKETSKCQECGCKWKSTKEMYDIMVCDSKFTLCYDCKNLLFHKLLKSDCNYNNRTKSQDDMLRIRNYDVKHSPVEEKEKEVMPDCYGMFLKKKKCRQCKFVYDCKETFNEQED